MRLVRNTRRNVGTWLIAGVFAFSGAGLAGCATAPDSGDAEAVAEYAAINDPIEPTNRTIFDVNDFLDRNVLRPLAGAYRELPMEIRDGIHNVLNNLRAPVVFFNDVLQGELGRAGETAMRFVINSTIGVAGIGDPATELGFEHHNEDFGQTLAVWGIGEGPYVMLPVFGPSNPRDTVGMVVDYIVDPFNWLANHEGVGWATYVRGGVRGIDERARNYEALDELRRSSLDYYAALRSLYRQRRADDIRNGKQGGIMPTPGVSTSPFPAMPKMGEEVSQKK